MTSRTRPLLLAALLGLATAACMDTVGPDDHVPGITLLSGPAASDTIDAVPAELLVLEVRGEGGGLLRSVPVEVRALPGEPAIPMGRMQVRGGPAGPWTHQAIVYTDAEGRASVGVRFGFRAGTALLTASAGGAGTDTIGFTVLPGAPARVTVLPADTVIYLNTTAALRAQVGDRYANPRTEGVTLSGPAGLGIAGGTVTGAAYGSHRVRVAVAGAAGVFAETNVHVAPRGTLAVSTGFLGAELRVFDLDGSNGRTLQPGLPTEGSYGMDWLPDGSGLLVAVGFQDPPRRLRRVPLQGAASSFLPGGDPLDVLRPRFTADGQWVFFIGRLSGDVAQVLRARPDGTGVTAMPNLPHVEAVSPSRDGSRFAWVSRTHFNTPMHVYDVAAGTSTRLSVQAENLAWSPRADRILYGGAAGDAWGVIGADGTGHQSFGTLGMAGADYMGPFDWSPDGEWIAYNAGAGIRVRQVATGVEVAIPHTNGLYPTWKP
jgi:hypothetical protein